MVWWCACDAGAVLRRLWLVSVEPATRTRTVSSQRRGWQTRIEYSAWQMIVGGIDLLLLRRLDRYQKLLRGATADLGFSSISTHERRRDNTGQGHGRRARSA